MIKWYGAKCRFIEVQIIMQREALVSIIMPVYNTGEYIKESVQSVIMQSYENWELIIVNDKSSDNSEDVLLSFDDKRIIYLKHEVNKGALESRNYAMRVAKGEYIAFLDSDDLWKKDKLKNQIEFMQKNNYAFTCTDYEHIDDNSNKLNIMSTAPKCITNRKFMLWNWCGCLTVMYNSKKLGKFFLENYKMRDDWALWLKISRRENCYLLAENLADYRIRSGSQSRGGIINLLKQHYAVFHYSEKIGAVKSFFLAGITPLAFIYRKLCYIKGV